MPEKKTIIEMEEEGYDKDAEFEMAEERARIDGTLEYE